MTSLSRTIITISTIMGLAQAGFKAELEYANRNDQYAQNMTVGSDRQPVSFYLDMNTAICSVATETIADCSKCARVPLYDSETSNTFIEEGPTDLVWYSSEGKTGYVDGIYAAD